MPTCGSSYFEFNKLIKSNYNSGSFDRILQENRSVFHFLSVNLIVVIGNHTQRLRSNPVSRGGSSQLFPELKIPSKTRGTAQETDAAGEVGWTSGHYETAATSTFWEEQHTSTC